MMIEIKMIQVEHNDMALNLHKEADNARYNLPAGDVQVVVEGEVWETTRLSLGTLCQFAGMSNGRWDSALPQGFVDAYAAEHGTVPQGIWSYENGFGGEKVFGKFISRETIVTRVGQIIYRKIVAGDCRRHTLGQRKENG
jgi:hypothetical protein